MENVSLVETTIASGLHGHLRLIIMPDRYLQITGTTFHPPPNPAVPVPVMSGPHMAVADSDTVQQNHNTTLYMYHKYIITGWVLKSQLMGAINQ
eukprot:5567852-Ditylum_brightwellii.AAC.2